jgi:MFS family permease
MLIVGRFIAGLSIGVLSMIVPVYQAEISPPVSPTSTHPPWPDLIISTLEVCFLVGLSS